MIPSPSLSQFYRSYSPTHLQEEIMLLLQKVALPSLLVSLSLWFVVAAKDPFSIQNNKDNGLICSLQKMPSCSNYKSNFEMSLR